MNKIQNEMENTPEKNFPKGYIKFLGNLKMPGCDFPDTARQLPDIARKLSNNYQYCPSNLQDYSIWNDFKHCQHCIC